MQFIVHAYGTEEELRAEKDRLNRDLTEKTNGGMIRRHEIWDISFRREDEAIVTSLLPRPHLAIKGAFLKLTGFPIIRNQIDKFLNAAGVFRISDDRMEQPGARDRVPDRSPEITLLFKRVDGEQPDGSEML